MKHLLRDDWTDCQHYSTCLEDAAKSRRPTVCQGCAVLAARASGKASAMVAPARPVVSLPAKPMARPRRGERSLTPLLSRRLCTLLERGHSVASATGILDLPESTLYKWMQRNPAFAAKVYEARDKAVKRKGGRKIPLWVSSTKCSLCGRESKLLYKVPRISVCFACSCEMQEWLRAKMQCDMQGVTQ